MVTKRDFLEREASLQWRRQRFTVTRSWPGQLLSQPGQEKIEKHYVTVPRCVKVQYKYLIPRK